MKKIKVLITLSLTLCVLAFGSVSVFALDVTVGDIVPAGTYVFSNDIEVQNLTETLTFNFPFISDGLEYNSILFIYSSSFSGLYGIAYRPIGSSSPDMEWGRSTGWVDDKYRTIRLLSDVDVSDSDYVMLFSLMDSVDVFPSGSGLAKDIFDLFQSISIWMVGFFGVFVGLFWTAGSGLTVLGVLAVIALGISIFFLIFAVVINFFRFRGR